MDKKRVRLMIFTKKVAITIMSVLLALYTSGVFNVRQPAPAPAAQHKAPNEHYFEHLLNHYIIPCLQFFITTIYRLYIKFTVINALVFSLKYLPSGVYLYKFVQSVYRNAKEHLKMKQMEIEDLVLEIAIAKTKQCVRETECAELLSAHEREAARLRGLRSRVQLLVGDDDTLLKMMDAVALNRHNMLVDYATDQDFDLTEFLTNQNSEPDRTNEDNELVSGKSEYSSVSEGEVEKDCQIKIIEVTNVYKVAYLKHFIKQKKVRRANRQATLKKKMSNIKKMLDSWQRALNQVMKDHKHILRREKEELSEDVNDSRTDLTDVYNAEWDNPGPFKTYYQEPDLSECAEEYRNSEYENYFGNGCENYEALESKLAPMTEGEYTLLPRLLEETSSQLLAVQEINSLDNDSNETI